ncbi:MULTISPECIES: bifunctional lysylphosphatidylglycerol flippase/synthetase MprF [unclassified Corynebacterium]|uniref:bifunctional lysylphosphatidylglycerol flippase/synthetase MprF n=1 Tax=unclassified Corynebacterium TaxID=2624378 RepID=UPI0035265A93
MGKGMVHTVSMIARWLAGLLRGAPVTVSALILNWLLFAVWRGDGDALESALGAAAPQLHPWAVLTAGLTGPTLSAVILASLVLLSLGLLAERQLGSHRYAIAAVVIQAFSVIAGLTAAQAVVGTGSHWGELLSGQYSLSPVSWVFGTAAFASASMTALWRRRVRAVVLAFALTLFLYSGIVTDFVRLAAVLIGLFIGQWLVERSLRFGAVSFREARTLLAIAMISVAVGPLVAGLNPDSAGPLSGIAVLTFDSGFGLRDALEICDMDPSSLACADASNELRQTGIGPFLLNQLPIILMAVIALGIARGRRLAFMAAVVTQVVTIGVLALEMLARIGDLGGGIYAWSSLAGVVVPWVVVLLLLIKYRRFVGVRVHRGAVVALFRRILLLLVGTGVVWILGALAFRDDFLPRAEPVSVLRSWLLHYIPPVLGDNIDHDLVPVGELSWALSVWIGVIFWAGVVLALFVAVTSTGDPGDTRNRLRAAEMLDSGTGDHLSAMTLWPGNRYFLTDGGYVAYRVYADVAVTVGEPVTTGGTDPQELARRFEEFVAARGRRVAWYSVRSDFAVGRSSADFHAVQVAMEAICDTTTVEFRGKKFQDVRTARNRAVKEGIRAEWTSWKELGPVIREQIIELSEEWVADKALPEMGFTLGGVNEIAAPDVALMLALDADDRVHGVTSWLPVRRDGVVIGRMLDFMRRDTEGFRPVVEFLIAETMLRAQSDGLEWVSLSGAPLAHTGGAEAGGVAAVLDRVGAFLEPLYGFKSLAAFKSKFHPRHESWYLCYRDELALPSIGVAIGRCYVPQMEVSQAVHVARVWAQG